jgi:hypothetical protein
VAKTATVIEMVVGAYKHHRRVHTSSNGLGDIWGKRHDHRKVRKRIDYRCSTSPGGIQVVDLYFPVGGTATKMIE